MPTLEVRRKIEPAEAVAIARDMARTLGHGTFIVTLDPERGFHVEYVLVFGGSPHMPSIEANQTPVMIICPYCERDVRDIIRHPHARGCPRPSRVYTPEECGQPDYNKGW